MATLCYEAVKQLTVLEIVLLVDVLEHAALLQPRPVERRLSAVPRQAHLLQPLHQLAAQKALHHRPLPTPSLFDNVMKTLIHVVFGELRAGHPGLLG